MESISRRVPTSMRNGTNWDDVQNTAKAAKKRRVQQQQEQEESIMLFTEEEFKGHLEKITQERYENSPDQISKTVEKVMELKGGRDVGENNELIV